MKDQVNINVGDFEPLPHSRLPDWNNFWLIPARSPHLREFVMSVEWNFGQRQLSIDLKETPAFSAFDWFSRLPLIEHLYKSCQANEEIIAICFFDEENHELARLEFQGLAIADHKCVLDHEEEDSDKGLVHELTLEYNSVKRVESDRESAQVVYNKFHENALEAADAEWQEKKEPVLSTEKSS